MSRISFWFKDNDNYVNIVGDNFYENTDGQICAFDGDKLVARFDADIVKGVYLTQEKISKGDDE